MVSVSVFSLSRSVPFSASLLPLNAAVGWVQTQSTHIWCGAGLLHSQHIFCFFIHIMPLSGKNVYMYCECDHRGWMSCLCAIRVNWRRYSYRPINGFFDIEPIDIFILSTYRTDPPEYASNRPHPSV